MVLKKLNKIKKKCTSEIFKCLTQTEELTHTHRKEKSKNKKIDRHTEILVRHAIIDSKFDCILSHATLMSISNTYGYVDYFKNNSTNSVY